MARDWRQWHCAYDEPDSALHRRLATVQSSISEALDRMPAGTIRAISMCAGEGRDLLGVLTHHPRATDVTARLVELDERLAGTAAASGAPGVTVVCADASNTSAYAGAVPADLVLVCGVFGNVSDLDIERTVRTLPTLCAPGAFVIWTRHRNPPDMTGAIRSMFAVAGFEEVSFAAPDEFVYGVGMHRLGARPPAYVPDCRMFTFGSAVPGS